MPHLESVGLLAYFAPERLYGQADRQTDTCYMLADTHAWAAHAVARLMRPLDRLQDSPELRATGFVKGELIGQIMHARGGRSKSICIH